MYRLTSDRGGVTTFVAVLMVGLLGMAAFALDTAAIYEERRELQNGADAAVLAIAEDCLLMPASCNNATATATADAYSDANAEDSLSLLEGMYLDSAAGTVTVDLRTEDESGSTVLAPIFGRVLGFDGASVAASASAVWGYAGAMETLPLIISECEWFDVNRPDLQKQPPFEGEPWLFVFHQGNQGRTCDHSNSGFDLPGGFGWLDTSGGPCRAAVVVLGTIGVDPGSSPPASCDADDVAELLNGVIFLPYYSHKEETGSGGTYTVSAIGAFWLTGYNFGGQYKAPANDPPCTGSTRCIAGYFIEATTSDGDPGGPDRGASIVKLVP